MKLYEFTFNDNTNMSESDMLALVHDSLKEEAILQGWAPGYNFHQCQSPKQLTDGEKEYFFVVEGDVLSGIQDVEAEGIQRKEMTFEDEIKQTINKYSMENGSNTPDHILAEYLVRCLEAFNFAFRNREKWYGRELKIKVEDTKNDQR